MFRDLLQNFWGAIEKRNTNVCLFKRFNIVRTVTGHERDVPQRLEGREDELLLRGGDAGVDPGVLHECPPRWFPFELFHSRSSHADVILGKKALINWLRRGRRGYSMSLPHSSIRDLKKQNQRVQSHIAINQFTSFVFSILF